jgi:hypothetical protein
MAYVDPLTKWATGGLPYANDPFTKWATIFEDQSP